MSSSVIFYCMNYTFSTLKTFGGQTLTPFTVRDQYNGLRNQTSFVPASFCEGPACASVTVSVLWSEAPPGEGRQGLTLDSTPGHTVPGDLGRPAALPSQDDVTRSKLQTVPGGVRHWLLRHPLGSPTLPFQHLLLLSDLSSCVGS